MIGVAGYLMAHFIKLKNYVAMLIVMLVKYFFGYECKFQCWKMAVFNLHSLDSTICKSSIRLP
ncbi:MAG: hypothetical protein A3J49_06555 [Gallionellales bacterium RIFCSPHIGHO2_02_FULL_57_16]|nr:MAG: hypothetical protein A3J49_06555 [Gallionellales bacterium RIFCSPHIGHO2_02_FULL_57_16]